MSTTARDKLRTAVGAYLGYTGDSSEWEASEAAQVDGLIDSGYTDFLYPAIDGGIHRWSFLSKYYTFDTVAETAEYDLPTDFGGIIGNIYFTESSNRYKPIMLISPELFQSTIAKDNGGVPTYGSITPTDTGKKLVLYPTPADEYELKFLYEAEPAMLSSENTDTLGGLRHFETIKAACLAQAELLNNDAAGGHSQNYQRRLLASIAEDKKSKMFDTFGTFNVSGASTGRHRNRIDVSTNLDFG
jgi:hypothetical protein